MPGEIALTAMGYSSGARGFDPRFTSAIDRREASRNL